MRRPACLLPLALLAPPASTPLETLTWRPEELTLVRTFRATHETDLAEMAMLLDGEERENPHAGSMEMHVTTTETYVLVDEILATNDERATHFERTFREIGQRRVMESPLADEPREGSRESELEGETVVFRWDEDEEAYELEFETDVGLDDELLEHLVEDATFRAFLPEGAVEEGDSWEVDIEAFARVMWPGGELGLQEEEEEGASDYGEVTRALMEELEGEVEATYAGDREEDGVLVAVIELEIEARTSAEMELEDERMGAYTLRVSLERVVEGELLWDVGNRRMHSFRAEGEGEEVNRTERVFETPAGNHEFVQRLTYEGRVRYEASLEVE